MRIVYCGELWNGGTCRMRMEALERLGHEVVPVDTTGQPRGIRGLVPRALRKAGWVWDATGVNRALLRAVEEHRPELVWIDKGLSVRPRTIRLIRDERRAVKLVHYSPDDMSGSHNQSWQYLACLPMYDLHVTTKSFNVQELRGRGARAVLFTDNAYCRRTHRPVLVTSEERVALGGPVGFIGAFERERAEAMLFLAENGVPVRVWGGGWARWARKHAHASLRVENRPLWGEQYARAICSFEINLAFLRKLNRDLQTTRSVEIPACGGFLLAERTEEHLKLFEEGVEAEFFGSREELLEKCRYYLAHPGERERIAAAGRERCLRSDYSYDRHVAAVLDALRSRADVGSAYAST